MAGNSFGEAFRITTFGESHGPCVGAVIDGCPPGIRLGPEDFIGELSRRRPGRGALDSPREEKDCVEILSGIFEGRTTGTPLTLLIRNEDVQSAPYEVLARLFRPGHADYTYYRKYGHYDHRGGGRSSARETAARVAAGVVAGKILEPHGVRVLGYALEIAGIRASRFKPEVIESNPCRCADPEAARRMEQAMIRAGEEGDSVGGVVEVRVSGCPAGLGEPVFDKLDADLAKAAMSVGAVKAVEIGDGLEAARARGSQNNDPLTPAGFKTNHAGGILGGISNGDEIIIRAAVKPIPSIGREQETIDREGLPASLRLAGRYDVCAVPRIVPVLEAMVRVVLADHALRVRALGPPAKP
ncbi:MAG: chorismate synthase [Deltaproteobacteria bacterium]|nr:MAG: chorismate synthase [Deltaproteobacteria bacterium]